MADVVASSRTVSKTNRTSAGVFHGSGIFNLALSISEGLRIIRLFVGLSYNP